MAALQDYARKRDFAKTPEPAAADDTRPGNAGPGNAEAGNAEAGNAGAGNAFVVQKHAARRLHYDLRLELDGVLKSWAVTMGPSLVPGDKKLAIEVEDHPLSYGSFEGNIPKGEYGGGAVLVWDNGTWTPDGDPRFGISKGHLRFELHGRKLGGKFDLVRIKKSKERQQPWLLIKVADEHARGAEEPAIVEAMPASVLTGRTIDEVAEEKPSRGEPSGTAAARTRKAVGRRVEEPLRNDEARLLGERADTRKVDPSTIAGAVARESLPNFVRPALAATAERAPEGSDWVHEIKLDGYRLQARVDHGRVKLLTRNGLDWTTRFGALSRAFEALPVTRAIIDGEAVVENEHGLTSFAELKAELGRARPDRFLFYAFDLIHLDGYDLTDAAFAGRRALLEAVMADVPRGPVRLSGLFETEGAVLHKHACRLGLEGIVSKRKSAKYVPDRSKAWVKVKCVARDEFIVVGYAQSTVSRRAIGSLALAYWKGEALHYAGKVGTGFGMTVAEDLWQRLDPLRRATAPVAFIPADADTKGVRWIEPRFVADVEYRAWTGSGMLRHSSFQGLRDDKTPDDLKVEGSRPAEAVAEMTHDRPERRDWAVRLTHPDRIYWLDAGVSKLGLAEYYAEIWPWIAPYVTRRPLSLVRCPGGTGKDCFYQKHAWNGFDARNIHAGTAGEDRYLWIDSLDGLVALAQAAVLEIHPWGSTVADPEHPDMLVFDLDPGEGLAFPDVEAAALEVRSRLADLGLASFVKTTGGKGLHVVLPVRPTVDWEKGKLFAQRFVEAMARSNPGKYLTVMAKAQRGGRIFLDYLRNGRGQTAVSAYSTRSRPGAPVSTPIGWEEIGTGILPSHFTLLNLPRRLHALGADPWADFQTVKQRLPPLSRIK